MRPEGRLRQTRASPSGANTPHSRSFFESNWKRLEKPAETAPKRPGSAPARADGHEYGRFARRYPEVPSGRAPLGPITPGSGPGRLGAPGEAVGKHRGNGRSPARGPAGGRGGAQGTAHDQLSFRLRTPTLSCFRAASASLAPEGLRQRRKPAVSLLDGTNHNEIHRLFRTRSAPFSPPPGPGGRPCRPGTHAGRRRRKTGRARGQSGTKPEDRARRGPPGVIELCDRAA